MVFSIEESLKFEEEKSKRFKEFEEMKHNNEIEFENLKHKNRMEELSKELEIAFATQNKK